MQISFDSLIDPTQFTESVAILIAVILVLSLYASIKLRSMLGMFGFMGLIFSLLASFIIGLPLLWFWLMVLVESVVLALAATAYVRASARGKY